MLREYRAVFVLFFTFVPLCRRSPSAFAGAARSIRNETVPFFKIFRLPDRASAEMLSKAELFVLSRRQIAPRYKYPECVSPDTKRRGGTAAAPPPENGGFDTETESAPFLSQTQSPIAATTPEPTVLPPSRIAKRSPCSIAMCLISSTDIVTLSPGMHISTPSGRVMTPVTSVVLK